MILKIPSDPNHSLIDPNPCPAAMVVQDGSGLYKAQLHSPSSPGPVGPEVGLLGEAEPSLNFTSLPRSGIEQREAAGAADPWNELRFPNLTRPPFARGTSGSPRVVSD